jgi:hypothetical protein
LEGIDTEYPQQCILTLKDLQLPVFDGSGVQMGLAMSRSDKRMLEVGGLLIDCTINRLY